MGEEYESRIYIHDIDYINREVSNIVLVLCLLKQ